VTPDAAPKIAQHDDSAAKAMAEALLGSERHRGKRIVTGPDLAIARPEDDEQEFDLTRLAPPRSFLSEASARRCTGRASAWQVVASRQERTGAVPERQRP
jgi:hypothetical protein